MSSFLRAIIPLLLFTLFAPLPSLHGEEVKVKETRRLMGTMVEIAVLTPHENQGRRAIEEAFKAIIEVDRLMSSYKKESDVSRLNRAAGKNSVSLSPQTVKVISKSLKYGELSDGAFDITLGSVKKLYKLEGKGEVPKTIELEKTLNRSGQSHITFLEKNRLFLPREGMAIDLGGIAKGYAIDRGIDAIKERGLKRAMINAGGDIRVLGDKGGNPWEIGIIHPRKERKLMAVILLKDRAVTTSGDYMQYFISEGERYSHILDPQSGQPARKSRSVTVIAPQAVDADALSTALFVMGREKGIALVEKIEDTEAMIIDGEGTIWQSSGFGGYLRK